MFTYICAVAKSSACIDVSITTVARRAVAVQEVTVTYSNNSASHNQQSCPAAFTCVGATSKMDDIEVTHAAFAASEQASVIVSTVIAVLKVANEAPAVLGVGASVGVLVGESVGLLLGVTDG